MSLAEIAARARGALHEVPAAEREDARRVLALCEAPGEQAAARRELVGLIERLGRRSSEAVAYASLARALNAQLAGDAHGASEALAAVDHALMMRGY